MSIVQAKQVDEKLTLDVNRTLGHDTNQRTSDLGHEQLQGSRSSTIDNVTNGESCLRTLVDSTVEKTLQEDGQDSSDTLW